MRCFRWTKRRPGRSMTVTIWWDPYVKARTFSPPIVRFGSPQAQIKAAMNMLGQPGGFPRPPLLPVDDAPSLDALRGNLAAGGLLQTGAA